MTLNEQMVHSSALPLFADIGRFNTLSETRSVMSSAQADDYLLSLGSLLDWDRQESITFGQYLIEATPFKEEFCSGEVSITTSDIEEPTDDSLSCSRIFYVNTLDTKTDTTDLMVVTMIPDHTYLSEHSVTEINYLDKAEYSGLILYSDIDGTYREALYFRRGRILTSYPLEPGQSVPDDEKIHYLTTYQSLETKSLGTKLKTIIVIILVDDEYYGGDLDEAYCVAEAGGAKEAENSDEEDIIDICQHINGGGSGGETGGGNSRDYTNTNMASEKLMLSVTLTAQKIDSDKECGTVRGEGMYSKGSPVLCEAEANASYMFDGWTGNMPGNGPWVSFKITENIHATAMFCGRMEQSTVRPCWDKDTKIMNPLVEMKVAPTNSGNLNNGIFNLNNPNRTAGKHQGLDLAAEVGTPIYAPCDGTISYNCYVTGQPNKTSEEYPNGYTGDTDSAGNRFGLECTLPSGKKITYMFWHLQAGTPVGINPREGRPFKQGDPVYQGDLIGYVGRTGNAYDIDNTHLHLGVRDASWQWVDPEPYLNGNTHRENNKVTSAQFENIDCDDKGSLNSGYLYYPNETSR